MSQNTPEDSHAHLKSVPLFAEFGDDSLARVAECAMEFEAKRGHVLAQPGQPGAGLFILVDGKVRVELHDRRIELGPGEFFGDLALLDDRAVHTGRVVAASDVRGLAVRRDDFDELLSSEPALAISMLKVLARRLAATTGF